jgi:hypothetical protein
MVNVAICALFVNKLKIPHIQSAYLMYDHILVLYRYFLKIKRERDRDRMNLSFDNSKKIRTWHMWFCKYFLPISFTSKIVLHTEV